MTALEFIKKYGWKEAKKLLEKLRVNGIPSDMRINIINNMWVRSSCGFTYKDLEQYVDAYDHVMQFGSIDYAKQFLNQNLPCNDSIILSKSLSLVEKVNE